MRNMDKLKLSAYEIIEVRKIADIESMGYILRHKKSGARVCVISNEDDNKVFSIGFRTPPEDETGVPHIIEHTTLCGSDKFPVKDPFIELAKGSLNTFLNAMTYPEKTLYPVASYNERDFKNLMEVAVDADGSKINSGQLEMSNVDLSGQFTDMIITQRGFQANSRVITVSDTLLEELINLKR